MNNKDNKEPEKLPLYFGMAGSTLDKFNEALVALLKCQGDLIYFVKTLMKDKCVNETTVKEIKANTIGDIPIQYKEKES